MPMCKTLTQTIPNHFKFWEKLPLDLVYIGLNIPSQQIAKKVLHSLNSPTTTTTTINKNNQYGDVLYKVQKLLNADLSHRIAKRAKITVYK